MVLLFSPVYFLADDAYRKPGRRGVERNMDCEMSIHKFIAHRITPRSVPILLSGETTQVQHTWVDAITPRSLLSVSQKSGTRGSLEGSGRSTLSRSSTTESVGGPQKYLAQKHQAEIQHIQVSTHTSIPFVSLTSPLPGVAEVLRTRMSVVRCDVLFDSSRTSRQKSRPVGYSWLHVTSEI